MGIANVKFDCALTFDMPKGYLDPEWVYEVIKSPKICTKIMYNIILQSKLWVKEQLGNSEPFPVTNMPVHLRNWL